LGATGEWEARAGRTSHAKKKRGGGCCTITPRGKFLVCSLLYQVIPYVIEKGRQFFLPIRHGAIYEAGLDKGVLDLFANSGGCHSLQGFERGFGCFVSADGSHAVHPVLRILFEF